MPTLRPSVAQAERQIDRGGRFADAALAGGDRDDRLDARARRPAPLRGAARAAGWRGPAARRLAAGGAGAAPALRSAVSATMRRLHARQRTHRLLGALAHRLPGLAPAPASTVIEKNTLPSLTTMSDSVPVLGSGVPSGAATPSSAREHLLFGHRHRIVSARLRELRTIRRRAEPVNVAVDDG